MVVQYVDGQLDLDDLFLAVVSTHLYQAQWLQFLSALNPQALDGVDPKPHTSLVSDDRVVKRTITSSVMSSIASDTFLISSGLLNTPESCQSCSSAISLVFALICLVISSSVSVAGVMHC